MTVTDTVEGTRGTAPGSATAPAQAPGPAAPAWLAAHYDNGQDLSLFLGIVASRMACHVNLLSSGVMNCQTVDDCHRLMEVVRESCRTLGLQADLLSASVYGAGNCIGDAAEWLNLERDEALRVQEARDRERLLESGGAA